MCKLIGQRRSQFVILVVLLLIPALVWAWSRKPPRPPAPSDFPLYGGVGGQFDRHAGLTPKLNRDLKWQIVRWQISSWVIDSIGWLEFKDSLLTRLNPPDMKILLQLRWNSPDLNPKPANKNQHCVPQDWEEWYDFCYLMGYLFKDDNVWFQIGNEPDHPEGTYWNGDIAQFVTYVNCGAEAIKEANPDAYVVCGGFIGGKGIRSAIDEIVSGLEENVDALDRHYYLENTTEATIDEYLEVWPKYCHERGYDCFVTELSPPLFQKAKEAGVDCVMMFRLWPGRDVKHWAANEDGIATETGREVGRWIEENSE